MANRGVNSGNSVRPYFLSSKITADGDFSHEVKRCLLLEGKFMTNLDSILKSRDITLPTKVHLVEDIIFPLVMYGCESWTMKKVLKNWCFWTAVLEKTLESPLDCKEIQLVNRKRNQSWIVIGRTDAEDRAPILWPANVKDWLIGKDPDAGKDWRQEEKRMTEDEMVGWHQLNGHEFEQAPGDNEGQGSLADAVCGVAKSHTWLSNWTTIKCSTLKKMTNHVPK